MKEGTTNDSNEDGLTESNTDKDSSTQNKESVADIPKTEDNTEYIKKEKTARKSNSGVKIEDYDLIVSGVKDATNSFKEVILSISKKAHEIKDKAEETFTVGAKRDARDIQALGSHVENITKGFEETMIEISQRNYDDQKKLLKGYKKLLEEQIKLINARIELVKRLKSR
jgi:hypothetical protein